MSDSTPLRDWLLAKLAEQTFKGDALSLAAYFEVLVEHNRDEENGNLAKLHSHTVEEFEYFEFVTRKSALEVACGLVKFVRKDGNDNSTRSSPRKESTPHSPLGQELAPSSPLQQRNTASSPRKQANAYDALSKQGDHGKPRDDKFEGWSKSLESGEDMRDDGGGGWEAAVASRRKRPAEDDGRENSEYRHRGKRGRNSYYQSGPSRRQSQDRRRLRGQTSFGTGRRFEDRK